MQSTRESQIIGVSEGAATRANSADADVRPGSITASIINGADVHADRSAGETGHSQAVLAVLGLLAALPVSAALANNHEADSGTSDAFSASLLGENDPVLGKIDAGFETKKITRKHVTYGVPSIAETSANYFPVNAKTEVSPVRQLALDDGQGNKITVYLTEVSKKETNLYFEPTKFDVVTIEGINAKGEKVLNTYEYFMFVRVTEKGQLVLTYRLASAQANASPTVSTFMEVVLNISIDLKPGDSNAVISRKIQEALQKSNKVDVTKDRLQILSGGAQFISLNNMDGMILTHALRQDEEIIVLMNNMGSNARLLSLLQSGDVTANVMQQSLTPTAPKAPTLAPTDAKPTVLPTATPDINITGIALTNVPDIMKRDNGNLFFTAKSNFIEKFQLKETDTSFSYEATKTVDGKDVVLLYSKAVIKFNGATETIKAPLLIAAQENGKWQWEVCDFNILRLVTGVSSGVSVDGAERYEDDAYWKAAGTMGVVKVDLSYAHLNKYPTVAATLLSNAQKGNLDIFIQGNAGPSGDWVDPELKVGSSKLEVQTSVKKRAQFVLKAIKESGNKGYVNIFTEEMFAANGRGGFEKSIHMSAYGNNFADMLSDFYQIYFDTAKEVQLEVGKDVVLVYDDYDIETVNTKSQFVLQNLIGARNAISQKLKIEPKAVKLTVGFEGHIYERDPKGFNRTYLNTFTSDQVIQGIKQFTDAGFDVILDEVQVNYPSTVANAQVGLRKMVKAAYGAKTPAKAIIFYEALIPENNKPGMFREAKDPALFDKDFNFNAFYYLLMSDAIQASLTRGN